MDQRRLSLGSRQHGPEPGLGEADPRALAEAFSGTGVGTAVGPGAWEASGVGDMHAEGHLDSIPRSKATV